RPYSDYIAWLHKQNLAEARSFWMHALGDVESATPLPPLGPGEGTGCGLCLVQLSPQATRTIKECAAACHVTLNTLLVAVWGLLLSRYSGESDVVFGITASGRPAGLVGAASMVGLFIATLPFRMRIRPDQKISEWLHAVQAYQAEAQQYDYTPL